VLQRLLDLVAMTSIVSQQRQEELTHDKRV
jgi:hypothetical protein